MIPMNVITVAAHKETARQVILERLRDQGATSPAMPASLDLTSDSAESALADLLAKGEVRQARAGLYFLARKNAKAQKPEHGFLVLTAILIASSIVASVVALAVHAG